MKEPRGYRNNNPLNIRRGIRWKGLRPLQTDEEFSQFQTMYYGFRAAIINICRTYYIRGWNTIGKICAHWAPSSENNTIAYISSVSKFVGLSHRVVLPSPSSESKRVWIQIIVAMVKVECGEWRSEYLMDLSSAFDEVFKNNK